MGLPAMPKKTALELQLEYIQKAIDNSVSRGEFNDLKKDVEELMANRKYIIMTVTGIILVALINLILRNGNLK